MTFPLFIAIFTVAAVVFTILGECCKINHRVYTAINISLSAIGAALLILSVVLMVMSVNGAASNTDWCKWARNMLVTYAQLAGPVYVILLGFPLIGAIISRVSKIDNNIMRVMIPVVAVASSTFLMMIAMFGYTAQNDTAPIDKYIMLSGIGQALTMRLLTAINPPKRIKKDKK